MLEQLDLALEQASKPDVHYARFAMMLTDNVVELYLHQLASDKADSLMGLRWMKEEYPHQAVLDRALGHYFEDKVRFARIEGYLSDRDARTIEILHGYRNEVYHVGVQHESILPQLASFYLVVVCEVVGSYEPPFWGWGSTDSLPDRSRKYLEPLQLLPDNDTGAYAGGPSGFKKGVRGDREGLPT